MVPGRFHCLIEHIENIYLGIKLYKIWQLLVTVRICLLLLVTIGASRITI